MIYSSEQPLAETLPFSNYRTMDNAYRRNSNRLIDDEDGHDGDVDEEDDNRDGLKKKSHEQKFAQQSRQFNLKNDSFSRANSFSLKIHHNSVPTSPNNNTSAMMMMMMKGNDETTKNLGENPKANFIAKRFHNNRCIAKSTEQLNRPFTSDNHFNYSFQLSAKTQFPISILKQSSLQRCAPSTILKNTSKKNACY